MRHEDAGPLLESFARDELEGVERDEVASHLEACPGCRDLLSTYVELQAVVRDGMRSRSEHPTPEHLVSYALEDPALDAGARQRCMRHLATCQECAQDAAIVRSAEAEAVAREPGDRWTAVPGSRARAGTLLWATAASLLVCVLAYPAYLGIAGSRNSAPDLRNTGPSPFVVIAPGTRGSEGTTLARPATPGAPLIVALEPAFLAQDATEDRVCFTIFDSHGWIVSNWAGTIAGARAGIAESKGYLFFSLATTAPGSYTVIQVGADGTERLHSSFEVRDAGKR